MFKPPIGYIHLYGWQRVDNKRWIVGDINDLNYYKRAKIKYIGLQHKWCVSLKDAAGFKKMILNRNPKGYKY